MYFEPFNVNPLTFGKNPNDIAKEARKSEISRLNSEIDKLIEHLISLKTGKVSIDYILNELHSLKQ